PLIQKLDNASGNNTLGLVQFAQDFQKALSKDGAYLMKVATGVDRTRISTTRNGGALWSVRLGVATPDLEPIAYAINNENNPALFAPRPISNQLQSEPNVAIYDYQTGKGLNPTPTYLDFVDIDMDVWGRQFLAGIDAVLSPE